MSYRLQLAIAISLAVVVIVGNAFLVASQTSC